MKKTLTLLALGGLFAASTVQAQVDIYITGSTAFRANAYRSIRALYGANLTSQNPASGSSANQVTWSGTIPSLFSAQTVTIHASYSGSVAGIQALVQDTYQNYLSSATDTVTNLVSHKADLAFSDVFQSSTIYQSTALDDASVGVLPFAWVKSVSGATSVTNVTIQQLQPLFSNGRVKLSYFTGNTNDTGFLYLAGRDSGSGTRMTAEKDALFVGTPRLWAPDSNCNWTNNNPGFSSGSGLAGVLKTCGPALGYLGLTDAASVSSGSTVLPYNGVMPFNGAISTPDFTPVRTGLYSFWCYEHLFARSSGVDANVTAFRTSLATEIDNDLATATTAIQLSTMKVSREADGGPISPN